MLFLLHAERMKEISYSSSCFPSSKSSETALVDADTLIRCAWQATESTKSLVGHFQLITKMK